MKNLFSKLSLIVLMTFFVFSCQKEGTSINPNSAISTSIANATSVYYNLKTRPVASNLSSNNGIYNDKAVAPDGDVSTKTVTWQGSLTGNLYLGASSKLREVLGITDATIDAHHIIPWAVASTTQHEVVRRACLDGFHPNDSYNGIGLSTQRGSEDGIHGNHPKYNDWVRDQMNSYITKRGNLITNANTNQWVQQTLIPNLRAKIAYCNTNNITINNYFITLPLGINNFIGL